MPQPASQLAVDDYLCLMVEAESKAGKTRSVGASLIDLVKHSVYIMECGTKSSLQPLREVTQKFEYDMIRCENDMENAIRDARKGVKENRYKGVFLDDFNLYGLELHQELYDDAAAKIRDPNGVPDGRPIWWEWRRRMCNTVNRLMDIKCHFVMACHPGSFMGKAGDEIPGLFSDVVYMRKKSDKKEGDGPRPIKRVFLVNSDAEIGRGSRNLPGPHELDADVGAFWRAVQDHRKKSSSKTSSK